MNLRWRFIYLGRCPSPSPLRSPDVLADVDVVDIKLSNIRLDNNKDIIDIIRLVARLFQQVRYSHDVTILLQPCVLYHLGMFSW